MVSFENFVKSMPASLLELKVTPSFCFPFKIPDDPTASKYIVLTALCPTRFQMFDWIYSNKEAFLVNYVDIGHSHSSAKKLQDEHHARTHNSNVGLQF